MCPFSKILRVAGIALLGTLTLASCNKSSNNDEPVLSGDNGKTYLSLFIRIQDNVTRAESDPGVIGNESLVLNGKVFGGLDNGGTRMVANFTRHSADSKVFYTTTPWRTLVNTRSLGLVVNDTHDQAAAIDQIEPATGVIDGIDNALTAGNDKNPTNVKAILMVAPEVKKNITLNKFISAEEAASNYNNPAKNNFPYTLIRAVAKSTVTIAASTDGVYNVYDSEEDNAVAIGSLTDLYFSVAGSSKKSYLNNPNKAAMKADWGYVRLGDDPGNTIVKDQHTGYYQPQPVVNRSSKDDVANISSVIYFFENIVKAESEGNTGFNWDNTAYNKVYGTFQPKEVYTLDNGNVVKMADGTFAKGTTFFVGSKNHKFYNSSVAAKADGNEEAWMYKDGRCVYLFPVYNAASKSENLNHNTYRNNFYLSFITKIIGVGLNYDPVDPNDPNVPKPGNTDDPNNPNKPVNPDEPDDPNGPQGPGVPIDNNHLYIKVSTTILNWNYNFRTDDLSGNY